MSEHKQRPASPTPKTTPILQPQTGRQGPEQDREDAEETHVDLYTKLPVPSPED